MTDPKIPGRAQIHPCSVSYDSGMTTTENVDRIIREVKDHGIRGVSSAIRLKDDTRAAGLIRELVVDHVGVEIAELARRVAVAEATLAEIAKYQTGPTHE